MELSVIISTYNSPEWLEKVLIGYSIQSYKDFELIIADDGSDTSTKVLIESFSNKFKQIKHVWHSDVGFRKCEILNKAIAASAADYLVFSDGDCIPRKDFLQIHFDRRKKNHFLSGGYFKLPMSISKTISNNDIETQNCFDLQWLKRQGLRNSFKNNKLSNSPFKTNLLNAITTTQPTWNGHNSSGWRKDILAVNGFDERMKYGGEDREMGERMMNNGIHGIQIRYSAICIHLDHSRGYVNEKDLTYNASIRKETKMSKATWTKFGIEKN